MRLPTVRVRVSGVLLQLAAAFGAMLGGAYLVGWWMVGVVLMAGGAGATADAVLRDSEPRRKPATVTHEDVLERYRRAR